MPQNAYCQECAARVTLAETGGCPNGHPRSSLRDVREGPAATGPVAGDGRPAVVAPSSTPRDEFSPQTGLAEEIIGKAVVWIPIGIVLVIALWSGYASSAAMGMSPLASWASSIGSLLLTIALLAFWVWRRRQKRR